MKPVKYLNRGTAGTSYSELVVRPVGEQRRRVVFQIVRHAMPTTFMHDVELEFHQVLRLRDELSQWLSTEVAQLPDIVELSE